MLDGWCFFRRNFRVVSVVYNFSLNNAYKLWAHVRICFTLWCFAFLPVDIKTPVPNPRRWDLYLSSQLPSITIFAQLLPSFAAQLHLHFTLSQWPAFPPLIYCLSLFREGERFQEETWESRGPRSIRFWGYFSNRRT